MSGSWLEDSGPRFSVEGQGRALDTWPKFHEAAKVQRKINKNFDRKRAIRGGQRVRKTKRRGERVARAQFSSTGGPTKYFENIYQLERREREKEGKMLVPRPWTKFM